MIMLNELYILDAMTILVPLPVFHKCRSLINTYTCITDGAFLNRICDLAAIPLWETPFQAEPTEALMWMGLLLWTRFSLVRCCCLLNWQLLTCALWVGDNNNGMMHFNWQRDTWNKMIFGFCIWHSVLWLPLIGKCTNKSLTFSHGVCMTSLKLICHSGITGRQDGSSAGWRPLCSKPESVHYGWEGLLCFSLTLLRPYRDTIES